MADCKSWQSIFALTCLHEWQDLWAGILAFAAGLLGFLAAVWAVRRTLQSERRQTERSLDALRKGLGAEVRHIARQAYEGAAQLKAQLEARHSIQIADVENATQFPLASVYRGNSALLGLLGEQTPEVVLFYERIDIVQQQRVRLRRDIERLLASGVTYAIGREQVAFVISPLIEACKTAVSFLPSLKTGTSLDANDGVFPGKVAALADEWDKLRGS